MNTIENKPVKESVVLSCRVPKKLAQLVKEFCRLDMHLSPADLLRDALREKIQRDAPGLAQQVFQENHEP